MIQLRPYQQDAVDEILSAFQKGSKHVLLCAPTGSGKTVMFSHIAYNAALKNKKVLILTDREELLMQSGSSIQRTGINPYYIQAGCKYVNNKYNVFIAMSQTLRNRVKLKYWIDFINSVDLVIIDEAHKQEFNYIFESGLIDNKFVIGFTATPRRSGKQRQLALDYNVIIDTVSVRELVDMGYLVMDDYFGCDAPDMTGVGIDSKSGDFKEGAMFEKFNNAKLYGGVVRNFEKICKDTQTIVFCVNIEHSIKTAIEFKEAGFNVRFVTSEPSFPKLKDNPQPCDITRYNERMRVYELYHSVYLELSGDRSELFSRFAKREFQILVNAGIATTGYDCPAIETVIVNRATMSTTLWLQMLGRGSRINESKTHFNILDFGGNAERLGHYTDVRLWALWHDEGGNGEGLPPIKECEQCKRPILAAYKICPFCGFKYPDKTIKEIDLSSVFFDLEKKVFEKVQPISTMSDDELHEYARRKGHKQAWLWRQLHHRGTLKDFATKHRWTSKTIMAAENFCNKL